jgi:hypothetical protein
MGAAAGFHHNQTDGPIDEPALELGAGQPLSFDDPPALIGDGELENSLRKIDAHDGQRGGSIHLGLSSVER